RRRHHAQRLGLLALRRRGRPHRAHRADQQKRARELHGRPLGRPQDGLPPHRLGPAPGLHLRAHLAHAQHLRHGRRHAQGEALRGHRVRPLRQDAGRRPGAARLRRVQLRRQRGLHHPRRRDRRARARRHAAGQGPRLHQEDRGRVRRPLERAGHVRLAVGLAARRGRAAAPAGQRHRRGRRGMKVTEAKAWLLARAGERGVELEVLATTDRKLSIEAQKGAVNDVSLSSSGGIGLRVVTDGRVGYAYTEELSEAALAWTLDEAIANAELQEDGSVTLPAGGALGRFELVDEGLSAPLQEKKAATIALEGKLAADGRVQSVQYAGYMERESEVEIASTTGVDGAFRTGLASLYSALVMREGDSVKQGYERDAQREFH